MVNSQATIRSILAAAVVAAAGVLAGCPAPPTNSARTQPALATPPGQEAVAMDDAPLLGTEPVSGGIYEPMGPVRVLTGDALTKARLERKAILELVKVRAVLGTTQPAVLSATLPATQPSTQPTTESAEPPAMAVKLYLQGREKFLQGANLEAMDSLEKSLQLDPEAFTVLRLMGRVCFAASQLARGSMYLERAQRLRPFDVEVNYLLGRYWLERRDFDRAVYYLMQADDSPERLVSSVQTPLSAFYLARAMQAGGYHLAAAKEYERYLEISALPVPGYRYDRELSYLIDEQWAAHLAAAENDAMAGDYAAALPHYQAAALWDARDVFIASRLVNALVRTNKGDIARKFALAFLDNAPAQASEDAIRLLAWAYRTTGKEGELISDLSARVKTGGDDATALLTLSAAEEYLGKKSVAMGTLAEYLGKHPTNMTVLTRLLNRVESGEDYAVALNCAAGAIMADRTLHDGVFKLFIPLTDTPAAAAYVKMPEVAGSFTKDHFAVAYLQALTLRAQNGASEKVQAYFSRALTDAPDFAPAREEYLRWLLATEKFAQATEIVRQAVAADQNNPKAWELLIQSEASQQRFLSALNLAKDAKGRFPTNVDIRMQLAAVYQLRGQDIEAETELQSLITDSPKTEMAYRMVIESQYLRIRRGGAPAGPIMTGIAATLAKMNAALPDSRYAQFSTAVFLARQQRFEDAEAMLRRLLSDTPDDAEVISWLAQIRNALNRPTDAILMLTKAIKDKPSPLLVRQLASMLEDENRDPEALAIVRKAMEENPEVEGYAIVCAQELNSLDKKTDAIAVMQAATKKFPKSQTAVLALAQLQARNDDFDGAVLTMQAFMKENGETTERLYQLAHFFSNAGNDDAATAAMQRVLGIMPDHNGANNDLGYYWVDAGTHIAEAEPMIRKAVENEPNNAAFQDSLAWLLYKQGKFPEAVAILEKVVAMPDGGSSPDVLGHYGDALYRAGRAPLAMEAWSSAQSTLSQRTGLSKDELKTRDYLRKVIRAVQTGNKPELSPLAEIAVPTTNAGSKSAGPATGPGVPAQ